MDDVRSRFKLCNTGKKSTRMFSLTVSEGLQNTWLTLELVVNGLQHNIEHSRKSASFQAGGGFQENIIKI
jgi:hypothetical protein